jgi:hypothetical protein
MKRLAVFLLLTAGLLAQPASDPAAVALVEDFLAAMGGRNAWAKVKFVHVEAVHDDLAIRDPFTNLIWNDFTAFRVRFEAKNVALDRRRGIVGDTGWRWRDGQTSALTPEQIAEERKWWEANIYRTLHRLAVRDPELSVRSPRPRRLEIFGADGTRLNWFVLSLRGEPMLFGTWASEAGTVFGPLASNGTVKYPKWGSRPDADFRYEIVRVVTAETVPADVDFAQP